MLKKIIVVRHCENEHTDIAPLTQRGREQAQRLHKKIGNWINPCGIRDTAFTTSPALRARETAQIITGLRRRSIDVLPELEISHRAPSRKDPAKAIEALHRHYGKKNFRNLLIVGHHQSTTVNFLIQLGFKFGIEFRADNLESRKLRMGSALIGYVETGQIEMFGSYAKEK